MTGVDGPLVRRTRGVLIVAGKVQVREHDQGLASQPRVTRVDGPLVDGQRGIDILDDHVQDLGQVEHGVQVPGVDCLLIRGMGVLRRVPVQEVAQIDQRLHVAGIGLPPVETNDRLDRGSGQSGISRHGLVNVLDQPDQAPVAVGVGEQISHRFRELARIIQSAAEQPQQLTARSFPVRGSPLSGLSAARTSAPQARAAAAMNGPTSSARKSHTLRLFLPPPIASRRARKHRHRQLSASLSCRREDLKQAAAVPRIGASRSLATPKAALTRRRRGGRSGARRTGPPPSKRAGHRATGQADSGADGRRLCAMALSS
jgi:hypothetical protein